MKSASEVKKGLSDAFCDVALGSGMSIRQCVDLDNYLTIGKTSTNNLGDWKSWQNIPQDNLVYIGTHGVFVHGGLDSIIFHLPAAMVYLCENFLGYLESSEEVREVFLSVIQTLENRDVINRLALDQAKASLAFINWIRENYEVAIVETEISKIKNYLERKQC